MPDARTVPAERQFTRHVYYALTKSLCGTCKTAVDAKIHFEQDQVWFDKFCPAHGHQGWGAACLCECYPAALSFTPPTPPRRRVSKPVTDGCPFDCGACPSHQ